jgi:transcription elongation factor GreB
MSKAFTKEDLEEPEIEPEPASASSPYITPEGYRRMQDELDLLWKTERPRVTREVEAAAALGDRSENAEYIYGKRRLREIDRRLRFLAKRLDVLVPVSTRPPDPDKVFFGAYVTLADEEGALVTYRLVGGDEFDPAKRWVSIDSPLGKALLGKRLGDVVTVRRPKGEIDLEITAVAYDRPAEPAEP